MAWAGRLRSLLAGTHRLLPWEQAQAGLSLGHSCGAAAWSALHRPTGQPADARPFRGCFGLASHAATRTASSRYSGLHDLGLSVGMSMSHAASAISHQARSMATRAPQRQPQRQETYLRLATSDPVRLVLDDGSHRIITYGEAVQTARAAASDLLMVARSARPPVMRLGDRQKALFAARQAEKEQRRRQLVARRSGSLKEVRVSAAIAEADLERQLGLARGFLEKGHKVRVSVQHPRRPGARYAAFEKLAAIRERVQPWAALEPEKRPGSGAPSILLAPLAPGEAAA